MSYVYYLSFIIIISYLYKKYCKIISFKKINLLFPRTSKTELDLSIYKQSFPFSFTKNKKDRCILLISGYRDTPFLWNIFKQKLDEYGIDYYAPRTHSNGRSYFQYSSYKDWILTYYEMIYMLQYQYKNIDIITLSAGSFIAIYISQFKYKCNINNIFMCSPYLHVKDDYLYNFFYKTIFYPYLIEFITFFLDSIFKFRPKLTTKTYNCVRDIYNEDNLKQDYYEFVSCLYHDNEIMKMLRLQINKLQINGNIIILHSFDDYVIPNVYKQIKYLFDNNIYIKDIKIVEIPNCNKIKDKCGHIMFKESDEILENIKKNIFYRMDYHYGKISKNKYIKLVNNINK
jgi:esterase/lipase